MINSQARYGVPLASLFVVTTAFLALVLTLSGFGVSALRIAESALCVALVWAAVLLGIHFLTGASLKKEMHSRFELRAFTAPTPFSAVEGGCLVVLGATLPMGEGVAYGAAALLLLRLLWTRGWQVGFYPPLLRIMGIGFVIWVGAGFLALMVSGHGWIRPEELGRVLPFLITPLVGFTAINLHPRWHRRAVVAFCSSLGISCGLALIQHGLILDSESWLLEVVGQFSSLTQLRAPGQGNRLVAGGFYFHRLKMAHVLVFGIGLIVSRQLLANLPGKTRIFEGGVGLLFVVVLFLTYTRAALLGVVSGAIIVAWFASRRWQVASLIAALVIGGVAVSDDHIRDRILSIGAREVSSERSLIWSKAIEIIAEHPAGVGLGNYPSLIDTYYDGVEGAALLPRTYAHNLMLSAWAETGPLGLLGYLWVWVIPGFVCWCFLRRGSSILPEHRWIAGTGLMILVSFWVVGLTHDVLYHKPVSLTFAAFLGLLSSWVCIPEPDMDGGVTRIKEPERDRGRP